MPEAGDELTATALTIEAIDGLALSRAFVAAAEALAGQADALNAINVFPVPDGDTGTNMSLTMRAAVDEIARTGSESLAAVGVAARQGTLLGARGNSGVILSQVIGGFAVADGAIEMDGTGLAAAFERGRVAAYRVVTDPREGTILTAISAAAEGAADCVARGRGSAEEALAAAVAGARDAVARTPELLPVLKEAGVVDAGAEGLAIMLAGMLSGLRGDTTATPRGEYGQIDASWLAATRRTHADGGRSGFCTEFVVEGASVDAEAVRARLGELGDSVLVVGGGDLIRVHVHTSSPDDAVAYGRTLGSVSRQKVEDMEAQFQALAQHETAIGDERPITSQIGVVAVAAGEGLDRLMRSLGVTEIVRGGQTMNPSAGEIRDAIIGCGARQVIVLPNNANIVLAAEQAAAAMAKAHRALDVRVVPSRSVPEGIAALVAMNAESPLEDNAETMRVAMAGVRSGEVTRAARATTLQGKDVRLGQPIGLVDGELLAATATIAEAAQACVGHMIEDREGALVTLYAGDGETMTAAERLAEVLRGEFGVEVETVAGGQPHYPYLIGVE